MHKVWRVRSIPHITEWKYNIRVLNEGQAERSDRRSRIRVSWSRGANRSTSILSRGPKSSEDLDANIGFASCVPQSGDFVVSDEYIHASVHDGIDTSRVRRSHRTFNHNSVTALQQVLEQIISEKKGADMGRYSVFVVVESEGDRRIGGGALSRGKWIILVAVEVSPISLSSPTFTDPRTAVIVTSTLIRDYTINHARSFIYAQLSTKVLELSSYFIDSLRRKIVTISPSILSFLPQFHHGSIPRSTQIQFPSPIIAVLTAYPRPLSAFEMNARPITWPTVPKGKDRVRVCLHAGNSWSEIDRLIEAILEWAVDIVAKSKREVKPKEKKEVGKAVRVLMESKLWLRFIPHVETIMLRWTYRVHDFGLEMLRSRVCCFEDIFYTRLGMYLRNQHIEVIQKI